ncbi:MAG: MBL fold metallo-hydrolase [Cypionkella sp.]
MARRTAAKAKTAAPLTGRATVRHYCQGIGDCHLLSFPKSDGSLFWMLIDCGVHSSVSGGSAKMAAIVADIAKQTKHIDVLVVTHEHTDHVSGFLTAADQFKTIKVDEVWLAWTENPQDLQAKQLDKYKTDAVAALQMASQRLSAATSPSPYVAALQTGLDAVIGFNFGATGSRVRAARDAAIGLAGKIRYLEPTDPPMLREDLGLRIYVLGPPRDAKLLGLTERASEMFGAQAEASPMCMALTGACAANTGAEDAEDYGAPFDPNVGTSLDAVDMATGPGAAALSAFVRQHYTGPSAQPLHRKAAARLPALQATTDPDQSWRRIDHDWLGVSADLAMQLDAKTNNTSLVLAFEFTDTGRVLLFAADAQIGNWLSWQDRSWKVGDGQVTGPDLLAHTVYYKVGHHGSHNATPLAKGLGQMQHPDLSAFVPTNAEDAKKVGWGQMPYDAILKALAAQCNGRVIRADSPWVSDKTKRRDFEAPSGSINSVEFSPGLWVELKLA